MLLAHLPPPAPVALAVTQHLQVSPRLAMERAAAAGQQAQVEPPAQEEPKVVELVPPG